MRLSPEFIYSIVEGDDRAARDGVHTRAAIAQQVGCSTDDPRLGDMLSAMVVSGYLRRSASGVYRKGRRPDRPVVSRKYLHPAEPSASHTSLRLDRPLPAGAPTFDDGPAPTEEDLMIAAIEAQCREWERTTGTTREVMWSRLPDELRLAVEEAQELFADNMRSADRPGW